MLLGTLQASLSHTFFEEGCRKPVDESLADESGVATVTVFVTGYPTTVETVIREVHKLLCSCEFPTTLISIVLVVVGRFWSVQKRLERVNRG